jgi:Tctex-1 family
LHGRTPALAQVTDWTNHIVDNCLRELQSLNKPFKYIITCIIMQKNGAGLNSSATMFWDPEKDNYCQASADAVGLSAPRSRVAPATATVVLCD